MTQTSTATADLTTVAKYLASFDGWGWDMLGEHGKAEYLADAAADPNVGTLEIAREAGF